MVNTIYKVAQCFFPLGLEGVVEALMISSLRAFM